MNLPELINEYKDKVIICSNTNYSDKQSVHIHNEAAKRQYEVVNLISTKFGVKGIEEFVKLLDMKDFNLNISVAVQLLEKMNPDKGTKEKALNIIREAAKGDGVRGLGLKNWLKNYETKHTEY